MKKYVPRAYLEEDLKLFQEKTFDVIDNLRRKLKQRLGDLPEVQEVIDKEIDKVAFSILLDHNKLPAHLSEVEIINDPEFINQEEVMTRTEFKQWVAIIRTRAWKQAEEDEKKKLPVDDGG